MAITRTTQHPPATPPLPPSDQQQQPDNAAAPSAVVSEYELERERRIRENLERLQQLGIHDLSKQVTSLASGKRGTPRTITPSARRTPAKSPSLGPTLPPRRSSRLQDAPPVTYVEPKEEKSRRNRDIVLEEGSRPEFYTEEHDKLLGSTELPWELFVDGYKDAERVYDPVNGKTCHQCRQKTLGKRTHCSQCNLVQGQFCGDCLYMRYGEHVVEANQNPNWICPPCRGICNCSLCRHSKGWAPTGALSRKVFNLGYRSVAHYLIATKRAPPENVPDNLQSAKRALPFEGMENSDDKLNGEKTETGNLSEQNGLTVTEPNLNAKDTGSPRRSKKENADDVMEPVTNSAVSETDGVSNMKSRRGVGRPRKRPINPEADGSEETLRNSEIAKNESVPEKKTPGKVGRPRKRPINLEADASEETLRNSEIAKDEPVLDKTPVKVGRLRKTSETEVGVGQESVIEVGTADESIKLEANASEETLRTGEIAENEPVVEKTPLKGGRPRKRSKTEVSDSQESVIEVGTTDEPASETTNPTSDTIDSEIKNPRTSGSNVDSIARRLRSRDRALVSVS